MRLRVEVNGAPWLLDVKVDRDRVEFSLEGAQSNSGSASVEEIMPGVYSVLLNGRSILVNIAPHPEGLEVWAGGDRYVISAADARDRAGKGRESRSAGIAELRAQMPGKIIKLLQSEGDAVSKGQGLLVVEAMKMQNEVKAPKDGTLMRLHVSEGTTVSAGDLLVTVE